MLSSRLRIQAVSRSRCSSRCCWPDFMRRAGDAEFEHDAFAVSFGNLSTGVVGRVQRSRWLGAGCNEVGDPDGRRRLGQQRAGVLHGASAERAGLRRQPGDHGDQGGLHRRRRDCRATTPRRACRRRDCSRSNMGASRRASRFRRDRACGRRSGCWGTTSTPPAGRRAARSTSWRTSARSRRSCTAHCTRRAIRRRDTPRRTRCQLAKAFADDFHVFAVGVGAAADSPVR